MPAHTADNAFQHLRTTNLHTLDRDDLAAAIRSSRAVRGWLDTFDIGCARRARELAATDGADSAESMLIDHGRRSGREAQATTQRETICNQVPDLETALAAGAVSTDHIDALAHAAKNLTDAERADLFAMGPMLADEATQAHVESFARTCRDMAALVHHQHHPGDDSAELDRQRAASKISRWVDRITGMHNTTISLDPLRDAQLWQLLDAEINRQKQLNHNSGTPFPLLQIQALFAALNHKHQQRKPDQSEECGPNDPQAPDCLRPHDNASPPSGTSNQGTQRRNEHDADSGGQSGHSPDNLSSDGADCGNAAQRPNSTAAADQPNTTHANDIHEGTHSDISNNPAADTSNSAGDSSPAGDLADTAPNSASNSHLPDAGQPDTPLEPPSNDRSKSDHPSPHDTDSNIAPSGEELCRTGRPPPSYTQPAVPDVYVHIDLNTLLHGPHTTTISELSNGTPLPVSTIRRLACDANIIPIVLNTTGELLDVGRAHRTATRAQRRALRALYRTCAHPHCTINFDNCRIHHIHHWENGGTTNLANMIPLCEHHHHQVHEGGWTITMTPNRLATWHHPTGSSPSSQPDRTPNHPTPQPPLNAANQPPNTPRNETYQPMLC